MDACPDHSRPPRSPALTASFATAAPGCGNGRREEACAAGATAVASLGARGAPLAAPTARTLATELSTGRARGGATIFGFATGFGVSADAALAVSAGAGAADALAALAGEAAGAIAVAGSIEAPSPAVAGEGPWLRTVTYAITPAATATSASRPSIGDSCPGEVPVDRAACAAAVATGATLAEPTDEGVVSRRRAEGGTGGGKEPRAPEARTGTGMGMGRVVLVGGCEGRADGGVADAGGAGSGVVGADRRR